MKGKQKEDEVNVKTAEGADIKRKVQTAEPRQLVDSLVLKENYSDNLSKAQSPAS